MIVLGAIAVDFSIAFLGERELAGATAAAANDAAARAVSNRDFYREGVVVLDLATAREVATEVVRASLDRGRYHDVRVTVTLAPGGRAVVASASAALAGTGADLHRLGVDHRSILPEPVLVSRDGRPILCGLADGGPGADPLDCASDISALGELLRWLLARAPLSQTATRRRTASPLPALLSLALRATNPDPRMRPSARDLATGLHKASPAATLPGRAVAREPRREPRQWPRAPARVVVAAVAVSLTLVAVATFGGGTSAPRASGRPIPREARPSTSVGSACGGVAGALNADVDGDGCPERLRFAGGVLDAGRLRWAVGGPADDVVTGDWDCDGRATLALLDRGTGGVYRLDAWTSARVVTLPLVAQVENATHLRVTHGVPPTCDVLTVDR